MDTNWDVIVVGAGMAGLSAAQQLRAAGRRVLVLEKSRGIGGRMATRRTDAAQWDHGAQYFTARSAVFRRQVAQWLRAKVIARWQAPVAVWNGLQLKTSSPQQRFVGTPTMNAPLRQMAEQLEIQLSTQVTAIERVNGIWQVRADSACWLAPQIVIALPAPQAAALIPPVYSSHAMAAQTTMQPCWALMLTCEQALDLPFAGVFINEGPLSWIAHDSSKAARGGQNWLLHACAEWSQAHLEDSPEQVMALLGAELNRLLSQWGKTSVTWQNATPHRWRYARGNTEQTLTPSAQDGLVVAGDWLAGGRVEGAYLSGLAAANALLATP
ncbi:NAD(P)/FAD-dependent oxidoreductase [Deefgea rivuli]|uniref:NAD(P)/FAD-dependent oxidoreductase n=1 Tax=Deefgea rivuli TaxID=400948 RepID=UPI0004801D53|nr:FAD-dependent oxidoreductase [Deefgea rivuli]